MQLKDKRILYQNLYIRMLKNFLLNSDNHIKSAYIWNTASGVLSAFQSIFVLIVIARVTDVNTAGIFSIAWAISHLALSLGRYGMRNFQATDIREKYSTGDYFASRIITITLMMMYTFIYVMYGHVNSGYSLYKCTIIFLVCFIKMIDGVQDIIAGWFQQKNRLDVATKIEVLYVSIGMFAFVISLLATRQLLISLIIWCVSVMITVTTGWMLTIPSFQFTGKIKITKKVFRLLYSCFPLCAVSFLTIYIGNAPKYAIDSLLNEEVQAYYNYLFMPVFSIGLLADFAIKPMLYTMGESWINNDRVKFQNIINRQMRFIATLTIFVVIASYFIGIPILSLLYATNLSTYRTELCILMFGGGFLALVSILNMIITIIRKQNELLAGYLICSLVALIGSKFIISKFNIMGAVCLYTLTMLLLCIVLAVIIIRSMKQQDNNKALELRRG